MKMGKTLAITAASGILVGLLAGCGGGDASSSGSTTPSGAGSSAAPEGSAKSSCSGAAGGQKSSCSGSAAGASSAAPSKN